MGILTDPSFIQKNKYAKTFINHTKKICFILYLIGPIWFVCLGHEDINHATYLSENALSPGLVYSEIKQESARYAQSLLDELNSERENHKSSIPYAWLLAKMKQIGLETHTHNFTLNYPYSGGKQFTGKNVYGILRAPRIGSTEGIIFSTPYRPPNSALPEITASVPILLAFADFARRKNYWAKDIIFLVTDQEQLGIHAWLEAYFESNEDFEKNILNSGSLPARAGALQAAINLEIQDFDAQYIDVKIEGLNGQLPNLDLFNLVQRLTIRESLMSGYKQTKRKKKNFHQQSHIESFRHILNMIISQANGVPTGNHGLFHRYRVEALTLESIKRDSSSSHNRMLGAISLLKTIEGISRSLNNLLERFHQSFFFYVLVANDRFVSIGDFMPCLIFMTGSLYVKAFLIWMAIDKDKKQNSNLLTKQETNLLPFEYILKVFTLTIGVGILAFYLPQSKWINSYLYAVGLTTEMSISLILIIVAICGIFIPGFLNFSKNGIELLHVVGLLYIGSALTVLGLLNFALGFLLSFIITPVVIFVDTDGFGFKRLLSISYVFLLQPLLMAFAVVFALTRFTFKESSFEEVLFRAITATSDALTYSILDWMIYGNWLFVVTTLVFFPAWLLFWIISLMKPTVSSKTKGD